ncbi:gliding motility-associated C-terminal domain-containing protein [Desertivirga arenae]|uniref:gliding motility-associated C-terminal domain-containing protein n=1 Tax=Desertivirga arenae TaxID=2810309 RepID=UPI001A97C165|nr:gliding motility-associated C-terminal domain-containing protein [Pedobacter sp. SYSU D00823]
MRSTWRHIVFAAALLYFKAEAQVVNTGQTLHLGENSLLFLSEGYRHDEGQISGEGTLEIKGNIVNNSSNTIFENQSKATVFLNGNIQNISGNPLSVPNLKLGGFGDKELKTNATITNSLSLDDRLLNIGDNKLSISSPAVDALSRSTGFITTNENGALLRNTNSNGQYLFPLGSIKNNPSFKKFNSIDVNPLYRPVIIEPENQELNTYTLNLVNQNPDPLYPVSQRTSDIEKVSDKYFYILDHTAGSSKFGTKFFQVKAIENNAAVVLWKNEHSRWEKVSTGVEEGILGDRLDRSLSFTSAAGLKNQVVSFADIPFIFFNAFSPDGDGKNDTWQIQNIELYPENTLTIFNRWGDEVYKTRNYSPTNSWDGSNLQPGTYFYVLSVNVNGNKNTYKGFITMVKKN